MQFQPGDHQLILCKKCDCKELGKTDENELMFGWMGSKGKSSTVRLVTSRSTSEIVHYSIKKLLCFKHSHLVDSQRYIVTANNIVFWFEKQRSFSLELTNDCFKLKGSGQLVAIKPINITKVEGEEYWMFFCSSQKGMVAIET